MLDDWEAMFEEREAMFDEREAICGCRAIIMPRRGPNWLSQVWHRPEQLGWGESVAKETEDKMISCLQHGGFKRSGAVSMIWS